MTCARVIKTRPSMVWKMWRALRLYWLRWELACTLDERERYESAGCVGPVYALHSFLREMSLRREIRELEAS